MAGTRRLYALAVHRGLDKRLLGTPIDPDSGQDRTVELRNCTPWAGGRLKTRRAHRGAAVDFSEGAHGVIFLRPVLGDVLAEACGRAAQLVPCELAGEEFFVLNILEQGDCLDEDRSWFQEWKEGDGQPDRVGTIKVLQQIHLLTDRLPESPIFRLARDLPTVIVDESIKTVMERGRFTGAAFERVTVA